MCIARITSSIFDHIYVWCVDSHKRPSVIIIRLPISPNNSARLLSAIRQVSRADVMVPKPQTEADSTRKNDKKTIRVCT